MVELQWKRIERKKKRKKMLEKIYTVNISVIWPSLNYNCIVAINFISGREIASYFVLYSRLFS